jgi:hypothetical protein
MDWLKEIGRRIAMLMHRRQFRGDLEEEMQLHLDLRREQQAESGMPSDETGFAAHRRFGNATLLTERSHMTWGWSWLESLAQDVLYGVRHASQSWRDEHGPMTLALGIGANTAIFTFMDAVMLRSLPVKDPKQLVVLGRGNADGITDNFASTQLYSYPFYRQMQQRELKDLP